MRKYLLLTLFALLPPFLSAARLTLCDGSIIYGQFISGSPQTVVFQDDNGVRRRIDLNHVQNIDFGNSSSQDPVRGPLPGGLRYGDTEADREDRSNDDWAVVPAGASIAVRTVNAINPQNASEGRGYAAITVVDVSDESGKVVIPRGTVLTLIVRPVAEGSTLTNANFVLDLKSVRVGGRVYRVNTRYLPAGYEAAFGTLTAATPGPGASQVLTAGPEIRVPSETVLQFRLQAPLHLLEVR